MRASISISRWRREGWALAAPLAALALFVVWAKDDGGFSDRVWEPGAILLIVLLGVVTVATPTPLREMPGHVRLAVGFLAAYGIYSFLSIAWSQAPDRAWEGANRAMTYAAVFALFAGSRIGARRLSNVLVLWILAMTALGMLTWIELLARSSASLGSILPQGRLMYPIGYANADACLWLMVAWSAVLLARSPSLGTRLRALMAAGAVVLGSLALLSLSRGSVYACGIMTVLSVLLLGERQRTVVFIAPIATGIAVASPWLLDVGNATAGAAGVHVALRHAALAVAMSALGAGAAVAAFAGVERQPLPRRLAPAARHAPTAAIAAAVIGLLWFAGAPAGGLEYDVGSFASSRGPEATAASGRLTGGLGGGRYDIYRVALDEFSAHPLLGIGSENFEREYLRHRRTPETPQFPHSVELRALTETGLIGAGLLAAGFGAALLGAGRATRTSARLARHLAAAAIAGSAYWLVHGSIDWFWEIPALGAPAVALLGLACALAPLRAEPAARSSDARPPRHTGHTAVRWRLAATATALMACASLAVHAASESRAEGPPATTPSAPPTPGGLATPAPPAPPPPPPPRPRS